MPYQEGLAEVGLKVETGGQSRWPYNEQLLFLYLKITCLSASFLPKRDLNLGNCSRNAYPEMGGIAVLLIDLLGSVAHRDSSRARKSGVQWPNCIAKCQSVSFLMGHHPDMYTQKARNMQNKEIIDPRANLLALKLRIITKYKPNPNHHIRICGKS